MSVIESFACSTPVLGARMGGIPELVKNGETGFTFAAHDAKKLAKLMQKIYNNNDMIKTMGGNARTFVEQNNSFDVYYERLMTVYQRAYAKKHPTYSEH
jgi:glycosyltransferase involved in cell wall biosynthesis